MVLDEVAYGNPTIEQSKLINEDSYVDGIFSQLTSFTFPKNSSDSTKEELNQIVKAITDLKKDENLQRKYLSYDRNMPMHYQKFLEGFGVAKEEISETIFGILTDTFPLLFKLKYYFQRPRPYQLAHYYKLKLMPFTDATDPSFPSGHAYQSKILSVVLGNYYPQVYAELQAMHEEICSSRISLGLHYQSDIDVGIYAAELVLQDQAFKIKYKQ